MVSAANMKLTPRIKANIEANRRIKEYGIANNIPNRCEMRLEGCLRTMYLSIAHKHKRNWYNGDVEKLSDPKEWVLACIPCHDKQENNKELTEELFNKLRP